MSLYIEVRINEQRLYTVGVQNIGRCEGEGDRADYTVVVYTPVEGYWAKTGKTARVENFDRGRGALALAAEALGALEEQK